MVVEVALQQPLQTLWGRFPHLLQEHRKCVGWFVPDSVEKAATVDEAMAENIQRITVSTVVSSMRLDRSDESRILPVIENGDLPDPRFGRDAIAVAIGDHNVLGRMVVVVIASRRRPLGNIELDAIVRRGSLVGRRGQEDIPRRENEKKNG